MPTFRLQLFGNCQLTFNNQVVTALNDGRQQTVLVYLLLHPNVPIERHVLGQRMLIAAQMYEDGVATARAAILDRRPDISQNELARQLRRRLLSRTLLQK